MRTYILQYILGLTRHSVGIGALFKGTKVVACIEPLNLKNFKKVCLVGADSLVGIALTCCAATL